MTEDMRTHKKKASLESSPLQRCNSRCRADAWPHSVKLTPHPQLA